MEWQPIETAPKDGTWVLMRGGYPDDAYDSDEKQPPVVAARWIARQKRMMYQPPGIWRFCSYDSGYYGEWHEPTHWMPLPAPPA
jgi:hypothetical protein